MLDKNNVFLQPKTGVYERPDTEFVMNDVIQAFSLLYKFDIFLFAVKDLSIDEWLPSEN